MSKELEEVKAMMATSVAEDQDIISRLTRKNTKLTKQNHELRKYAKHTIDCGLHDDAPFKEHEYCTCGLEELLHPKKQDPV